MDARRHRRLPAARPFPQVHVTRAAHQPAAHRIGTLALAHLGNRAGNAWIALGEEVGKDFAAQEVTFAVLHRARSRQDARLARESSEEVLREGVDRIDSEAPARTIEHAGKQRPGARLCFRIDRCPEIAKFPRQCGAVHPHPARKHGVDAHGHLRRTCLGEGEAQHLRGIGARLQQQPQHARGQNLGLARPRACGEPHAAQRIDRETLLVLKLVDRAAHASSPSWCAIHSSRRMS